ncbi:MAG: hypothetical protein J1F36_04915 [Clostridiales bacterium]|nr:hypothetical protein [Clostridiales bacterium]
MILNAIFRGIKAVVDAVAKVIAWLLIALGLWIPLVYTLIFVVVVAFTSYTMAALSTVYFFGLFIAVVGAMLFSLMRSTKKAKERKHKSQTGYNISEVQRKDEDPIERETPPTIQNEYTYYEPPEDDPVPPIKQTWEQQVQQFREEQAKAQYVAQPKTEQPPVQRSMWDEPQEPIRQTWEDPQRSNSWGEPKSGPDLWHTITPATREEKPKTDRWGAPISDTDTNDASNDTSSEFNPDLYDTSWSPRSRDRRTNNWDEPKNNWGDTDWGPRDKSAWDDGINYSPKSTEWNMPRYDEPKNDWSRQNDRSRNRPRSWDEPFDDYRSEPRQNGQNYRPDYNRRGEPQNYDNYNDYNRPDDYNRPMDNRSDYNRPMDDYNRPSDYNRPMDNYGAPMDNRPMDDYNRPMSYNEPVSDEIPKIFRLREDPNVLVYEYSDRLDYYKRSSDGNNEFLRRKYK